MENTTKQTTLKFRKRETKQTSIYSRCLITKNIVLPITCIGKNVKDTIEKNISYNFEGKCLVEGYIKQNSTKLITYSSGLVKGTNISFEVVFECEVCFPVEGMLIQCVAKDITKAGIKAESANEFPSPVIVFVAKDHHYSMNQFAEIKEGDKFNIRVIGQRFELNDKYISVIGKLVKPPLDKDIVKKSDYVKPKIVIEED